MSRFRIRPIPTPAAIARGRWYTIALATIGFVGACYAYVTGENDLMSRVASHVPLIFMSVASQWAGIALIALGLIFAMLIDLTIGKRFRIAAIVTGLLGFVFSHALDEWAVRADGARLEQAGYDRCQIYDETYRDRRGHLQTRLAWVPHGSCKL